MNSESAAVRKLLDDGEFQGGRRRKSDLFTNRPGRSDMFLSTDSTRSNVMRLWDYYIIMYGITYRC